MSAQRSVLITGGTSGIGRALVERYHGDGLVVFTCGRSAEALAELRAAYPGVVAVACELSDAAQRRALVDQVRSHTDTLDGLINNAAIVSEFAFTDGADHLAELEREVTVNLVAPIDLGHLCAPLLAPRGGFIANISSDLALVPLGHKAVYCATKAGLSHYTAALRFQQQAVRVLDVILPLVDTPMTKHTQAPKLTAQQAAREIVAGIQRGDQTVYVGDTASLQWQLRLWPNRIARRFNRSG